MLPAPPRPPGGGIPPLAAFASNLSLYVEPGLSVGALLAAFRRSLGLDFWEAFDLGFFIPLGFVYLTYASGWGMRRTLAQLMEWRTSGLIQAAEYDQLRRSALAWSRARRFGS